MRFLYVKIKGMKNQEKNWNAVQALLEHINDFGGVESMYAGAASADCHSKFHDKLKEL